MFNLFGRQSPPPAPDRSASAEAATRPLTNPIAEIEHVGEAIIATLTVTELSDDQGATLLADLLDDLAQSGALHLILDIQNVQFMNSACLGCLVGTLNRLTRGGGRIAMVNPAHSVQSLFRLTRLDSVFQIYHDVPSALMALEGKPEE